MSLEKKSISARLSIVWLIIIGIAGSHTNSIMPAIIGTLSSKGNFGAALVGFIASLELVGMTISIVALAAFVNYVPNTRIVRLGSVLLLASNIASIFSQSYFLLCIFRFFAGAGAGLLLGLASSRLGKSASPQRMFGIFYCCSYFLSMLAYQVWCYVERFQGVRGPYMWLSLVAVIGFLTSFQLTDDRVRYKKVGDDDGRISIVMCGIALIGIFLFNIAGNGLWSHVVGLGVYKGIHAEDIQKILSYAQIASFFGMIVSAWIGPKLGSRLLFPLGGGGFLVAMLSIILSNSKFVFAAWLFVFIFFWAFSTPFVISIASILDPKGRLAPLSMAAMYGGLAVAPAISGALLGISSGEYTPVFYFSIILLPISFVLLIYASSHSYLKPAEMLDRSVG